MNKRKTLKEDFLVKRMPTKPVITKIVSEDLGNLYATDQSNPYAGLNAANLGQNTGINLKLTSVDGHTIEIKQGESSFNVANDKFVLLTKTYLTAIMNDLEKLKKMSVMQERKISQLNSKIESMSGIKSKLDSLTNRVPQGAFRDGGN